ncbi:unnamed protein product, partial [Porites evermanni]
MFALCQASDLRYLMTEVRCQTSDVSSSDKSLLPQSVLEASSFDPTPSAISKASKTSLVSEAVECAFASSFDSFSSGDGKESLEALTGFCATATTTTTTGAKRPVEAKGEINEERIEDYKDRVLKLEEENLELKRSYEHLMEARAVTFKTSAKSFKSQRASNTWEDGGTEKKKKFWLTAKVHVTQEEFGGTDAEASFSSVR